jgi:hypothetical protein
MSTTDNTSSHGSPNPTPPARDGTPPPPVRDRVRRLPSRRVTAAAAAVTLGVGVAIGAAIGPAPQSSFARTELPGLLATLLGRAASAGSASAPTPPAASEASGAVEEAGPRRRRRHRHKRARVSSGASMSPAAAETEASSTPSHAAPTGPPRTALKPVTSVWLIELSGESFAQSLAAPAAAPYIDSQLVPAGTLESSWTALDGSAFANDAALAGLHAPVGSPSPIVNQIIQPPCPEGSAGAACAAGTPGQITAADAFVKQAVTLISANALYRAHGLLVVTFASVAQASAAGLPEGATSATLTEQPPAGVLLLSPFIRAGVRSASTFDSTSPTHALRALLGK